MRCPRCFHYKRTNNDGRYPIMKIITGDTVKMLKCPLCGYKLLATTRTDTKATY